MKKDKNTKRYKTKRQKDKKGFNDVMLRQFHTLAMFLRKCIHGKIAWKKGNFAMNATLHF